ncbi:MAG TPA: beta-N-acetylhexosaminidase [Ideonella sp.]|uniref:beta-N-acetylhexosaminidase n=1 Tax=Ideonella sp. TaxID=1929293 RepID=UPI002C1784BA|nr:beta-N-acetylhexosaminidase [Ideonella sp.]HSI47565.1 beta-N-acetylhexosaminidase [Ideonella sp.]
MHAEFHPGHLVMVDIEGTSLSEETAAFLRRHRIRAVCLFRRNLGTEAEVRKLCAELREVLGPRALIAIDQEGGSVNRFTALPHATGAMAIGAIADTDQAEALAEATGAAVARGLISLGINWNLAPVLDVNNNPANPVIGERSFGSDPHRVARLTAAWMRGSLSEGVACCLKHFPGHGDTHVDSHHALPTVDKSLAELEALELIPFRALTPHAPSVMTAHIVYPQLDAQHPATLSHRILTGLLRQDMGHGGVVLTDALMMKAIHERYGHARAAVLTLQAGADMPLAQGLPQEQAAAVQAIELALREDELLPEQLQRSAARLDALAARFPATPRPYAPEQRAADEALARDGWRRGLTALAGALPPATGTRLRVLTQARVDCDGVSEAGLAGAAVRALFALDADVAMLLVEDLPSFDFGTLPDDGRTLVLVSNHRKRYPAAAATWQPALHIALWNPFQVLDVPAPSLVSWGHAEGALEAVTDWLAGRLQATGVPPVELQPTIR